MHVQRKLKEKALMNNWNDLQSRDLTFMNQVCTPKLHHVPFEDFFDLIIHVRKLRWNLINDDNFPSKVILN